MARLASPVRRVVLLGALVMTLAAPVPVLAAGERDPRCEDWEGGRPPAGIDMSTACPVRELRTEAVDLDSEPLLPYVVGLVVMAGVLGVFGVIAMQATRPDRQRHAARIEDWWSCPSCSARNRPDRAVCFSCQTSRAEAVAVSDGSSPTTGGHPA